MTLLDALLRGNTICEPDPCGPTFFQNYKPARDIFRISRRRILYEYPSIRMRLNFMCESQAEEAKVASNEIAPDIDAFVTQPMVLRYEIEGNKRHYTPDGLILRVDGSREIYEVKPDGWDEEEELETFFSAIGQYFRMRGVKFTVYSESDVKNDIEQTNARTMCWHCHKKFEVSQCERVSHLVVIREPTTLGELEALLGSTMKSRFDLLAISVLGYFNVLDTRTRLVSSDSLIGPSIRRRVVQRLRNVPRYRL